MTTDLTIPDVGQLQQESSPLIEQALALTVKDAPTFELAGTVFRELGGRLRVIEAFFKPIKQSLDQTKRTVLDRERLVTEPIESARRHCNTQMADWSVAQERQRREAEKKAQDDAAMAEAEHHQRLGDPIAADAALNGHGIVAVSVPSHTPKVAGVSQRETWAVEVNDLLALVKAVAAGTVSTDALLPNLVYLAREARAHREGLHIPGVVPVRKVGMAG